MTNTHHDAEADNRDVRHEESDVNIRAIFAFAIGLFVVALVVHIGVYFMFVLLSNRESRASAIRTYPLAIGQENRVPPEPRLQTNPQQDLRDLRAAEEQILNGYRWVDRNAGVVGIPVSEAMRLTLLRGLPSRPAAATPAPPPAPPSREPSTGNR
ncbi:MAG: hypothetical protein GEU82_13750 [Luteitalea sp.]|nr:hypothetical protein [Luteitalea sp.]